MNSTGQLQWRTGKRVAIVGAGPGGVSAAIAFHKRGFDVRLYEKNPQPKALGGAVLLSTPVLAILRNYGIDLKQFGHHGVVEFRNNKNHLRCQVPINKEVEKSFGIDGWHYGILRSDAFAFMMELLPEGMLVGDSDFESYVDNGSSVSVKFKNDNTVEADIVVGADGIRSGVSTQAFGDPGLFHVGLRVWLAWCEPVDGIPPNVARITHSHKYQASFFPMMHDGQPGYEWWVVEPCKENTPAPKDTRAYMTKILSQFSDPFPALMAATDMETQMFKWDIYNRPSLHKWSKGRVVCLGDAVHPVSPYAAYGMGMAIEDGYFLARALEGVDLTQSQPITKSFQVYEDLRVGYTNYNTEFARKLGNRFHQLPYPLAKLRDFVFDHTKFLDKMVSEDYLGKAERMSLSMKELHVNPGYTNG